MITTRNRAVDLRRTLAQLAQLNPTPEEILITADGCTDDTVQMVKAEMEQAETRNKNQRSDGGGQKSESNESQAETLTIKTLRPVGGKIRLIVNEVGRGSVASRDRMMREAKGDLVLALDDDSYPEQTDCLNRITKLFAERPALAVLHFPQRTDEYPETLTQTDFGPKRVTRSFANSGAVLRRSVYLQLAGFEPSFFHMYEEPDYALQCVGAGYEVLYSPIATIRHHFSGQTRNELRNHHRHARNECWSTIMRCPLPQMIALVGYRVFSQFRYACQRGLSWAIREPVWWMQALAGFPVAIRKRQPIQWESYKAWLMLP